MLPLGEAGAGVVAEGGEDGLHARGLGAVRRQRVGQGLAALEHDVAGLGEAQAGGGLGLGEVRDVLRNDPHLDRVKRVMARIRAGGLRGPVVRRGDQDLGELPLRRERHGDPRTRLPRDLRPRLHESGDILVAQAGRVVRDRRSREIGARDRDHGARRIVLRFVGNRGDLPVLGELARGIEGRDLPVDLVAGGQAGHEPHEGLGPDDLARADLVSHRRGELLPVRGDELVPHEAVAAPSGHTLPFRHLGGTLAERRRGGPEIGVHGHAERRPHQGRAASSDQRAGAEPAPIQASPVERRRAVSRRRGSAAQQGPVQYGQLAARCSSALVHPVPSHSSLPLRR